MSIPIIVGVLLHVLQLIFGILLVGFGGAMRNRDLNAKALWQYCSSGDPSLCATAQTRIQGTIAVTCVFPIVAGSMAMAMAVVGVSTLATRKRLLALFAVCLDGVLLVFAVVFLGLTSRWGADITKMCSGKDPFVSFTGAGKDVLCAKSTLVKASIAFLVLLLVLQLAQVALTCVLYYCRPLPEWQIDSASDRAEMMETNR
eukprot:TRINITY_DN917_c0_g1_i3.p2 TRINITY_DN917_c0_g1~~TRINITY_DN917_c0_g1_i3.p2  ORF type:complete len:201 (+),score=44.87 TRINITY_DN917_c0_g1_i3:480-1082(+)